MLLYSCLFGAVMTPEGVHKSTRERKRKNRDNALQNVSESLKFLMALPSSHKKKLSYICM